MTGPDPSGRLPSTPEGRRPRAVHRFRPADPRRLAAVLAVATGMTLAGTGTSALVTDRPGPPKSADIGALPVPQSAGRAAPAAPAAPPIRIRIPSIGLDHTLTGLQVQQDGRLGAPQDPGQIGWWRDGPRPGDPGAAIIVGHVDSLTGPAAFYNLSSLRPGDRVTVDRSDHSHATFTVRALRQYDRDDFPDDQVYAVNGAPALRLITCGGTYDRDRHEYRENLVVYATPAAPGRAHPSASPPPTPTRSGN
ncbi:class F sortase [Streptomyces sp. NBC_01267]|uniref:class F sortase n=1 Tax=unclassified Streptomyces TaxID=2593676 RepID=UPI002023E60A|nr:MULTISPECIES: class F sortase [unclassified Streptomyces]MCX4549189.1 class F sortase [Streptomyces sp. NBC_01500]WSC20760.1 class F sortase [Streptomyces sp. NBC_01766]WSV54787.1 class F sortase [Streptomyces sp. NBC_01014]